MQWSVAAAVAVNGKEEEVCMNGLRRSRSESYGFLVAFLKAPVPLQSALSASIVVVYEESDHLFVCCF